MKEITVKDLLIILKTGIDNKEFTKETKVLLTDDDEMNGLHTCWGWSTITKSDMDKYFGPIRTEEKDDSIFLVLG